MANTFDCSCGERLVIPPAYTGCKLFCLRCRRAIPIPGRAEPARAPESAKIRAAPAVAPSGQDKHATTEIATPVASEQISATDGSQFWKLTCPCGKRLLAPANTPQPYGHCPKCGRHLPLPGFHPGNPADPAALPLASHSAPDGTQKDSGGKLRDDHATTVIAAARVQEHSINLTAASTAAARLRPSRVLPAERARTSSGRISAWPLAGRVRRLLAAFIDFSFAAALAATAVALAGRHVRELFTPVQLLCGTLLLLLLFNDTVVHLLLGGSLGKHLVMLAIRTEAGAACGFFRLLARTALKWLFIPGWLIGALDPAQRAAHDLLAGTLVLKGRPRHKP